MERANDRLINLNGIYGCVPIENKPPDHPSFQPEKKKGHILLCAIAVGLLGVATLVVAGCAPAVETQKPVVIQPTVLPTELPTQEPTTAPTETPVPPTETPAPPTATPKPTESPELKSLREQIKAELKKFPEVEISFRENVKDYFTPMYCPPPDYICKPFDKLTEEEQQEIADLIREGFWRAVAQSRGKIKPEMSEEEIERNFLLFLQGITNEKSPEKDFYKLPISWSGLYRHDPNAEGDKKDFLVPGCENGGTAKINMNKPMKFEFAVDRKGISDAAGWDGQFEVVVKPEKNKDGTYPLEKFTIWLPEKAAKEMPTVKTRLGQYVLQFYAGLAKGKPVINPWEVLAGDFWNEKLDGGFNERRDWRQGKRERPDPIESVKKEVLQVRWQGVEYDDWPPKESKENESGPE